MAAYNAYSFLPHAYAAICAQTVQDFEVIVADDLSTDETVRCAEQLIARDPRVRLVRAAINTGPGGARNRAIAAARGEWLIVLDCDDFMHPARLETLLRIGCNSNADVVLDNAVLVDPATFTSSSTVFAPDPAYVDGEVLDLGEYLRRIMWGRIYRDLGILKPAIRRSFLERTGLRYNEALRCGEDSMLMLHCLQAGAKFVLSHDPTYFYTMAVSTTTKQSSETSRTNKGLIKDQIIETQRFCDDMRRTDPGLPLRQTIDALVQCRCSVLLRRAVRGRNPALLRGISVRTLGWTLFYIMRERSLRRRAVAAFGDRRDLDDMVALYRAAT